MIDSDSSGIVSVVLCDARAFDRSALAAACGIDGRIAVRGETGDFDTLLELVASSPPGVVVLIGVGMLRAGGGFVYRLHDLQDARVLAVGLDDSELDSCVQRLGLDGAVRRDGPVDDLLDAIVGATLSSFGD